MIKVIVFAALVVGGIISYDIIKYDTQSVYGCHEPKLSTEVIMQCAKRGAYKVNEMVNGCVMQKSGESWIRTCG